MTNPIDPSSHLPSILEANAAHEAPPRGTARPERSLAIVTCMDARIDPLSAFGLAAGDAHVIRNAGGRVTADVLRSLALSVHLLGTREVGIVHHTGCALEATTQDEVAERIVEAGGPSLAEVDFDPFEELDEGVTIDVGRLRGSGVVGKDVVIWGGVYEVETGRLRIVTEA